MPNHEPRKLTSEAVARLPVEPERYEVADLEIPGLRLRVTPAGVKSWAVLYRNETGRRVRYTIGKASIVTAKQARDTARTVLGAAAGGKDPAADKRQKRAEGEARRKASRTLRQFLEGGFAEWAHHGMRGGAATVTRIGTVFPGWMDKPLSAINPWLIQKWQREQQKTGLKAATINRDLTALATVLREAVTAGLISASPVRKAEGVKRLKEEQGDVIRCLTDAEEKRLRKALADRDARLREERKRGNTWREERGYDLRRAIGRKEYGDHITPMVLLALNTGMRRGEIFKLEWRAVELAGAHPRLTVTAATAKAQKSRIVPINAEAAAVLTTWRGQQASTDGLAFPSAGGAPFDNINKAWGAVLKVAEVKGFRFHDMRHTFATRLVEAGVSLRAVQELLGHGDSRMTEKYAHVSDDYKTQAVAKLGGRK